MTAGTSIERGVRIKTDSALNRPVEDWGKLLGDVAAVTAMLDRLLHHGHVLKCGPRSWRTKTAAAAAGSAQMRMAPVGRPSQNRIGRRLSLLGTLSPNPWDLAPCRQNGCSVLGGWRRPAHFRGLGLCGADGRWVGAPVASLRCRILRPGEASISRAALQEKTQMQKCEKTLPERSKAR